MVKTSLFFSFSIENVIRFMVFMGFSVRIHHGISWNSYRTKNHKYSNWKKNANNIWMRFVCNLISLLSTNCLNQTVEFFLEMRATGNKDLDYFYAFKHFLIRIKKTEYFIFTVSHIIYDLRLTFMWSMKIERPRWP